jgi:hypothetical protein
LLTIPSKGRFFCNTCAENSLDELSPQLLEKWTMKIGDYTATRGVQWHFNPPAAPHMGGSLERMVRSVKTALKDTMKTRVPKEEILKVLLKEAADLSNGRPLTHVSVDADDPVSITPNDILRPGAYLVKPCWNFMTFSWRRRREIEDKLKEHIC